MNEGIVLRAVSGVYIVQADGQTVQCTLRGNLKKEFQYTTSAAHAKRVTRVRRPLTNDTISVGDRVRIVRTQEAHGVIEEILPRTRRFGRSGFRGREQNLVSNLDQVCIVFACVEPRVDPWKLDRFLVAAESEDLGVLIVANKNDLVAPEEARAMFAEWEALGYRVIPTSARTNTGLEPLRAELDNRVSAFVGPSGVGKSTLLNALLPNLNLQTGDIGYVTYKGKHTTTAAQLLPLPSGGWVADTPGLRQLDLLEADPETLLECFPEMREHIGQCRFDDCRHDTEPDCALKAAVERGDIGTRRFQSYRQIVSEMGGRRD